MRSAAVEPGPGMGVGLATEESVRPTRTVIVGLGGHCAMAIALGGGAADISWADWKRWGGGERGKEQNKHTAGNLNQVRDTDIVLCCHIPKSAADRNELCVFAPSSTLVTEDDGAVTGPCKAVVKRDADRGAGIIVTGREQVTSQIACHCAPDVRTGSLSCDLLI